MHWALVAHRDQRDINLSSLRMLIVADGANPCEYFSESIVLIQRKVLHVLQGFYILLGLFINNQIVAHGY